MRIPWQQLLFLVACGPSPADISTTTGTQTAPQSTGEAPTGDASPTAASIGTGTSTTTGTTAISTGSEGSTAAVSSTGAVDMTTVGMTGATTTDTGAPGCGGEELLLFPGAQVESGLELCPDGTIHRHTAVACEQPANPEPCGDGGVCQDAPCDQLGAGICANFSPPVCRCVYPCLADADCADGTACICATGYVTASECRPADCRTDADCGGFECGLRLTVCDRPVGLFCRTKNDECKSDQDCAEVNRENLCRFDIQQQIWRCEHSFRCP